MESQFDVRLGKLNKLKELGIAIYPYHYDRTHQFQEIIGRYQGYSAEELEKTTEQLRVAGRIVAIRDMGKSAFLHLFDGDTRLQIYVRKDLVSEKEFAVYRLLDIGDIIGAGGRIFRTRAGELTLLISELTFLSKCLHPLPEKWHGLQDIELRFRHRYLDLIMNEESRNIFKVRSRMIQRIRQFFYDKGYVEVETPMMQPIPGGASARPFVTHHNTLDSDFFLRVAPELYLKRLLVGGMEKIFEINRNFRNEGIDMMHNPEFCMLEFYELYKDFNNFMDLTEELFASLNQEFLTNNEIIFRERKISLHPPFRRIKYMESISQMAGLPLDDLWNERKLSHFIKNNLKDEPLPPTFGKMLDWMFAHYVEASLLEPTLVMHYPKAISPLSKVSRGDERETERFELIVAGMEIANGFSELNDPLEQRARFEAQVKDREKGDEEAQRIDRSFLVALEHGLAPAAGEGIGIDRLVMLYTGAASIKDVLYFPLLKPKNEV